LGKVGISGGGGYTKAVTSVESVGAHPEVGSVRNGGHSGGG